MVKIGTNVAAMEAGFKKADGLIASNAEKFKKAGRAMTVAGGAIVGSLGLMVKGYVAAGDEVHKMALRTSFSTEALSELKYAAEISGATLGDVEKGIKKMSKTIVDATDGLTTYVRAFDRIGLTAEELMDLSPEEQFDKIAQAIARVENPTIRAAAAQDIFGRAGTKLLPLFAEGEEGLEALRAKAREMGIVFDQEAANKAAALNDAMTTLSKAFKGVGYSLADTLVPAITGFVDKVTSTITKIKDWIKEHPILSSMLIKIVGGLGLLATGLGPILIMLPGMATAVKLLGVAFKSALGPIGLVTVAIVAAAGALNAWINAKKKALDVDMAAMTADKTLAEMHELRRKAIENGIMTQKEWAAEVNKFGKDYKAFLTAVSKAPEYEVLRGELESIRKVEEDLGEETKVQTAAMIAEKLKLAEAIKAAYEKITGLTRTMTDEILKCEEDEITTAKRHLDEKLADRIKTITAIEAAEGTSGTDLEVLEKQKNDAIKTARESHLAELEALDKTHADAAVEASKAEADKKREIDLNAAIQKKELRDALFAEQTAWNAANIAEQEELVASLNQLEMGRFQYANWLLDEKYEKEKETTTNRLLLDKEYDVQKKALEDAAHEEKLRKIEDEEAARKQSLERTLADISMVLGAIGGLFQMSYQNNMIRIDNEEKRRMEAIDNQYNAQIEALTAIEEAEKKKTKEVLDAVNREYDDKKQHILDNMEDNEKRDDMLVALEVEREDRLAQARMDREIAEQEAADAIEAIETAKAAAIEAVEVDLEGKRTAARRTAAKQEKAVALLSAIVNTAAAVTKALSTLNIPLAIAVGVLGAVQIALIASKPIPLKEGGIVTSRTEAVIGEAGPEAVIPLNKLGGGLQPAPVYVKQSNYFYGDINNAGDIDEISDRLARRMTRQLERGRRS